MITQVDRRKYKRIKENVVIEYKWLNGAASDISQSLDLGEGGACFLAKKFIPMAQRLILKLSLPGVPGKVKIVSKIAWMDRPKNESYYRVGVQFLNISKSDLNIFNKYLVNHNA